MTCIVGYVEKDVVHIGGDSAGVGGYSITLRNEEYVRGKYGGEMEHGENVYEIHTEYLDNSKFDFELKEFGRSSEIHEVYPYSKVGDEPMVMDALDITVGPYKKKNNKELMSLIFDLFEEYCEDRDVETGEVYLNRLFYVNL